MVDTLSLTFKTQLREITGKCAWVFYSGSSMKWLCRGQGGSRETKGHYRSLGQGWGFSQHDAGSCYTEQAKAMGVTRPRSAMEEAGFGDSVWVQGTRSHVKERRQNEGFGDCQESPCVLEVHEAKGIPTHCWREHKLAQSWKWWVPHRSRNRTAIWSSSSPTNYISKEERISFSYLHPHVYCSCFFFHNSQNAESA